MLPVINAFKTAHNLTDVTMVADAGMISEANQIALQASGQIPYVPDVVTRWRQKHPDEDIPDRQVFIQPWAATTGEKAHGIPDRVIARVKRFGDRPIGGAVGSTACASAP